MSWTRLRKVAPADAVSSVAGQPRPRRRDPLPPGGGDAAAVGARPSPTRTPQPPPDALFGNVALAKEETRAVWVSTRLEQCLQDLRFGCRILTRSPGVSLTATILIALVIGGNTTVFSIAHGVLAKPSARGPCAEACHRELGGRERRHRNTPAHQVYTHFLEHSTAFQPIAAFDFARLTMTLDSGSYAVRAGIVSPNYFDTLGVRLVKGRSFLAEEAKPASSLVVVLAHHIWQNNFAGRGRHRRTAGHREWTAGNDRRRCRVELSWRALPRARRSLDSADWRSPRSAAVEPRHCRGNDRTAEGRTLRFRKRRPNSRSSGRSCSTPVRS